MNAPEIERLICQALPGAKVEMRDLAGDNDHWAAHVSAPQFVGKSRIEQHKLVYRALGGRVGGELHALQLTTSVPN